METAQNRISCILVFTPPPPPHFCSCISLVRILVRLGCGRSELNAVILKDLWTGQNIAVGTSTIYWKLWCCGNIYDVLEVMVLW